MCEISLAYLRRAFEIIDTRNCCEEGCENERELLGAHSLNFEDLRLQQRVNPNIVPNENLFKAQHLISPVAQMVAACRSRHRYVKQEDSSNPICKGKKSQDPLNMALLFVGEEDVANVDILENDYASANIRYCLVGRVIHFSELKSAGNKYVNAPFYLNVYDLIDVCDLLITISLDLHSGII
ncbi:hypothetical protein RYX36_012278 [Vicia faba]